MIAGQHRAIIEVIEQIINLIKQRKKLTSYPWAMKLARYFSCPARWETLARWVPETDLLDDIFIDEEFTTNVMAAIGHPTCFQHFAYGGSLGVLRDGVNVVEKLDGYNWDCDPYLPWYAELANVSKAKVRYNPLVEFLPSRVLETSPGAKLIRGDKDWDNQQYPSAVSLIGFYMHEALALRARFAGYALRAIACALHLLADLCVPHHILNTIGHDHAEWERTVWKYWKRAYVTRSAKVREAQCEALAADVDALVRYHGKLYVDVASWTIDRTCKTMVTYSSLTPSRIVVHHTMIHAIAATIIALCDFVGEE